MIILRQKTYSKRTKVAGKIIRAVDSVAVKTSKSARTRGAKVIAKSIDKDLVKRKTAELRAKYPNNPKIAERKIAKVKSGSSQRQAKDVIRAEGKLETISPSKKPMTQEQVEAVAHKLTHPTVDSVVEGVKSVGSGVVKGTKKVYTDTGKVMTGAASAVVKNPAFELSMRAGDVANYIGATTGHPEICLVPVGGILAAGTVPTQQAIIGRKGSRKLRRLGNKIKNSKLSNWNLKDTVNNSSPYFRNPVLVGV